MNIYFSGIGGVGIGPLAEIAHDAGYSVAGSDLSPSLVTDELTSRGIVVNVGPQDGVFLQSQYDELAIDWFVHTAALTDDHSELMLAKQLGIRTAKRDELLAHIIAEKQLKLIAITGTHGKTTTTGMMVWAMQQLGIAVSYSIGTTIGFGPSGRYDPASEYFVYECDEFDRNFLHFSPYFSIVTAVDHDHTDTYPTESEYLDAFRQFVSQSTQAIGWNDQHAEAYDGLYQISLIDPSQVNNNIHVVGEHNRRNATLVETALRRLGVIGDIEQALSSFPGTDRRFEKLADNLYSDYGHHPIEIAATLQLAREVSDHVVLVYQPHQNVRQHEIRDQYIDQFELADDIYWLPTYLSREDQNLPILPPDELIQHITNKDHVHVAQFDDDLWNAIERARGSGALVLGMGAGAIDGWLRQRLTAAS
jgi:UDP-N-acetylmuramate--alanine ligase